MSKKHEAPKTTAVRALEQAGIQYGEHLYRYVETSILNLPIIAINGDHRGFIIDMDPADLGRSLDLHPVNVATDPHA